MPIDPAKLCRASLTAIKKEAEKFTGNTETKFASKALADELNSILDELRKHYSDIAERLPKNIATGYLADQIGTNVTYAEIRIFTEQALMLLSLVAAEEGKGR